MEKGSLIDQRFECLDPVERPEPGMSFAAIDHTGGEEVVVRLLPAASDSDQSVFFRSIEKLVRMSGNHIEKVLDAGLTPYPDLSAGAAGGPDGSAGVFNIDTLCLRIDFTYTPVISMIMRSRPSAMPPCGGGPYSNAYRPCQSCFYQEQRLSDEACVHRFS